MTVTTGNITQFTTVDRAPDASWFVDFMDRANALPGYAVLRDLLVANLRLRYGDAVLDVGCGTGDDAREVAQQVGTAGRVVGIDLSTAMIEEAMARHGETGLPLEFRVADLAGLDIEDGAFDRVRAKLVLMHCDDMESAARELVRVTRRGGRIAIFDYDFDTATIDHPNTEITREIVRCCSDGHPNNWSGRQLARRFQDLGVQDVTITPHTVVMPFDFFHTSVGGRLAAAQANGVLALSAEELASWWRDLAAADARGRFFTSLTGFVLGATRS